MRYLVGLHNTESSTIIHHLGVLAGAKRLSAFAPLEIGGSALSTRRDCKVHERVISQTQGSDGFLVVRSVRGLLVRWRANNVAFQVSIIAKQITFRTENIGNVSAMETAK